MSARPIGEIIPGVLERARSIAALCRFIDTFDRQADRKDVVMRLYTGQVITAQTAELIIEHFGLEAV
jgi:hypothetical protein